MRCTNCGANIDDKAVECPFCGSAVSKTVMFEQPENNNIKTTSPTAVNPLLDKEYNFSGNDLVIKGKWGEKVNVKVGDDRLYFETIPAKNNVLPAVMLEDIMAINESFYMRTANIVIAIIGAILGFAGGVWWFVFPVFVLLFYRERKIQIHLRNSNILTIYANDKELSDQFIEDMKKITKIRQ